jgi:hypothetical protein
MLLYENDSNKCVRIGYVNLLQVVLRYGIPKMVCTFGIIQYMNIYGLFHSTVLKL